MIRRRCRVIVVTDAAIDPECAFEDLGNVAQKIYIDQGVSMDFEALDLTPDRRHQVGALLRRGAHHLSQLIHARLAAVCEAWLSYRRACPHPKLHNRACDFPHGQPPTSGSVNHSLSHIAAMVRASPSWSAVAGKRCLRWNTRKP